MFLIFNLTKNCQIVLVSMAPACNHCIFTNFLTFVVDVANLNFRILQGWNMEYFKYDLIRDYFLSIPLEEQDRIWAEVGPELERREAQIKRLAARKALSVSAKK